MTFQLDTTSYNKAKLYPKGEGWGAVYDGGSDTRKPEDIQSIIIHTTNGKPNTTFAAEADYLFRTNKVSAHYLNGKKRGQTVQFLDPTQLAWHAGTVIDSVYANPHSIGIENHYSIPGDIWTNDEHQNLTELVEYLLDKYSSIKFIETHRWVATPKGRKQDPSGWDDTAFYQWRDERLHSRGHSLVDVATQRFRVVFDNAIIRTGASRDYPEVGRLNRGDLFLSDGTAKDLKGQVIAGFDGWVHIFSGTTQAGAKIDDLGFIHESSLKLIG